MGEVSLVNHQISHSDEDISTGLNRHSAHTCFENSMKLRLGSALTASIISVGSMMTWPWSVKMRKGCPANWSGGVRQRQRKVVRT